MHNSLHEEVTIQVRLALIENTQSQHNDRIEALEATGQWNLRFTVGTFVTVIMSSIGMVMMLLARGH